MRFYSYFFLAVVEGATDLGSLHFIFWFVLQSEFPRLPCRTQYIRFKGKFQCFTGFRVLICAAALNSIKLSDSRLFCFFCLFKRLSYLFRGRKIKDVFMIVLVSLSFSDYIRSEGFFLIILTKAIIQSSEKFMKTNAQRKEYSVQVIAKVS